MMLPSWQILGMILENKMSENLSYEKIFFYQKMTSVKVVYLNLYF